MTPTEDQQALALARWLEAGARGAPPEGLDPEVLEAIFALRPELAPAPRVSADDILASVATGPFAEPEETGGGEVVPFPVHAARPATPAAVSARPRNQGIVAATLGSLLAAAAALVLVLGAPPERAGSAPAMSKADVPEAAPAPLPVEAAPELDAIAEAPADEAPSGSGEAASGGEDARAQAVGGVAKVPVDAVAASPQVETTTVARSRSASAPAVVGGARVADDDGVAVTDEEEAPPVSESTQSAPAMPPPPSEAVAAGARDEAKAEAPEEAREDARALDAPSRSARLISEPVEKARASRAAKVAESPAAAAAAPPYDASAAIEAEIATTTRLATTDPIAAAERLSRSIRPPVDAGQRAAIAAASWTLDHDRPDLAHDYATRGLALGNSGALADLLRALQAEAATKVGGLRGEAGR